MDLHSHQEPETEPLEGLDQSGRVLTGGVTWWSHRTQDLDWGIRGWLSTHLPSSSFGSVLTVSDITLRRLNLTHLRQTHTHRLHTVWSAIDPIQKDIDRLTFRYLMCPRLSAMETTQVAHCKRPASCCYWSVTDYWSVINLGLHLLPTCDLWQLTDHYLIRSISTLGGDVTGFWSEWRHSAQMLLFVSVDR